MINLIDLKKIFNKMVLWILLIYGVLFASAYIFIFFSDVALERVNSSELVKYVQWYDIFIHNTLSSFTFILLGILSFGVISTVFFLYDFYLIVFAAYGAYTYSGSFLYSLTALLTHGVVEVVAISINVYLSTISFRFLINWVYKKKIFYVESRNEIMKLIGVMVCIFLIASFIEAFVTPKLLEFIVE
ncbi:stage II sporulation protein M [Bacillus bingmayongensis]|uniref:stage II sporulation protein M n=1 Tax=Bacillus bingmayongensis TaxID=1150157 RepID=UPI000300EF4B|nr:stage II sporulation protein M [Bacillus bingmayongensis]MBY0595096.1 stage II sporulation protein M [Bacillus bingmayongensis]